MRFLLFGLILALAALLWWTNPEEEQFTTFVTEEVTERLGNVGADGARAAGGAMGFIAERLGREAGQAIGGALGRAASEEFERSNYLVASTYTLDLNGRASGGEWTFLGIAGQFFPLEQPENLETLIRDLTSRR
ncbi:MAG TPA: DUF4359 domain-containing protein [Bacteroidetes bacterium]|nr:DUF4359 domain-containing protein [Bacteroidota bacterium]